MTHSLRRRTTAGLIAAMLLGTSTLSSAQMNRGQTIQVDADSASYEPGQASYRGDVILVQGGLTIIAESLDISAEQNTAEKVIAEGDPAVYQQTGETERQRVKASAGRIEYDIVNNLIVLTGDAQIQHNGSEIRGARITYNADNQIVKASADDQGAGRVKMILQPAAQDSAAETAAPETSATEEPSQEAKDPSASEEVADGDTDGQ